MKYLICLLFCILIGTVSNGQKRNDLRVNKLPELIEDAASNKNYKQASKLEKELIIRKKIQKAIQVEAYNKAVELREDLYELERSLPRIITDTIPNKKEVEIKNKKDNLIYYMDFSAVGINRYDLSYDQSIDNSLQGFHESQDAYSINFKMGHKFYFGPGTRKLRVGIDINYVALNLGISAAEGNFFPNYALSGPSPGFVMTYHMSENSGIDLQTNAGLMVLFSEINKVTSNGLGVTLLPQIRYWNKKFGVGLEYTYFYSNVNNIAPSGRINLNHFGLFVGIRL